MGQTFSGQTPPHLAAEECRYGRLGALGRALRDGWDNLVKHAAVVLLLVLTAIVGALLPPGLGGSERVAVAVLGAFMVLGIAVAVMGAWALTPWGRRSHWENVFYPATLGGPLGGTGCELLSHHSHSLTYLWCDVTDPDGNTARFSIPQDLRTSGEKYLTARGERLNTIVGAHIWQDPPTPGKYRFVWKAYLGDGRRPVTVARARYVVKGPPQRGGGG